MEAQHTKKSRNSELRLAPTVPRANIPPLRPYSLAGNNPATLLGNAAETSAAWPHRQPRGARSFHKHLRAGRQRIHNPKARHGYRYVAQAVSCPKDNMRKMLQSRSPTQL